MIILNILPTQLLCQSHRTPNLKSHQCCAIRLAAERDLQFLAAIEDASRPGGNWNAAQVAEELTRERATVLVDEQDGDQVAGWLVTWHVAPDELHVLELAVAPHHRRKGVATSLLRCALGEEHRRGATIALLEVRVSNTAAIEMYEKLGFVSVGRRKKFYSDGEDAVLMNLEIQP